MKECNGNQKLAQLRYEYKEQERQSNYYSHFHE
jgi:hypothetical protein